MLLKRKKKALFLGKNLNYLLSQHSLDIKNLALASGIPAPTLVRMKKADSNPTLSSIEPLLDFFRIDMDSFLYKDLSDKQFQDTKKVGELIHLPLFTLQEISLGVEKATVSKIIAAVGITGKNAFAVSINTDILTPAFQSNSIIIIDPDLKPIEADYVLCYLDDLEEGTPVFRQLFIDGKNYYFKSMNTNFSEMKHYEKYKILGVIIKSIESYR